MFPIASCTDVHLRVTRRFVEQACAASRAEPGNSLEPFLTALKSELEKEPVAKETGRMAPPNKTAFREKVVRLKHVAEVLQTSWMKSIYQDKELRDIRISELSEDHYQ